MDGSKRFTIITDALGKRSFWQEALVAFRPCWGAWHEGFLTKTACGNPPEDAPAIR